MSNNDEHNGDRQPESAPRSMGESRLPDPGDFDFGSIQTPEELLTPKAAPVLEASTLPPPVDRGRAPRDRLVPRWVWMSIAAVVAVIVIVVAAVVFITGASRVVVPDVTGVPFGEARATLAQVGLEATVAERRFSSEPAESVISQSPIAGQRVAEGSRIGLVVSAGTEEFSMPDVVGDGIALARGVLEARGLAVRVENVTSDEPSDTVLSTIPAPGAVVRSGDVVRVQVASPQQEDVTLKRYDMQGVSVVVDPGEPVGGRDDVTLDIARRIRSLLEASGATVVMLRSGEGQTTSASIRAQAAETASATAGIGFSVRGSGDLGRIVTGSTASPSTDTSGFASLMLTQVNAAAGPAKTGDSRNDAVFAAVAYPWSRVSVGSWTAPEDASAFSDPRWADSVARAVYTTLGRSFGTRSGE